MSWLTKLGVIFDRVVDIFAGIAGFVMLFMIASICTEIVMRYFINRPLIWVVQVNEIIMLYLTFLGVAWVLRREGHVRVDVLTNYLKPRARNILNVITSIIGAAACLPLVYYGAQETWLQWAKGGYTSELPHLPVAPILVIIPIGSVLFFIQFMRQIYRYARYSGGLKVPPHIEAVAPTELKDTLLG